MTIHLQNIRFRYSNAIPLLEDVSLKINSASFTFIVGLNGSGKSTLLKILAGLLKPESGNVKLGDFYLSEFSEKRLAKTLAFVPQNYSPAFPVSVFDFVAMGRTPYLNYFGTLKKRDTEIINENLELLEIKKIERKSVTEISGGELRRAVIARALSQEPKILLLDEPSAFLDIEHQLSIFEFLEKLNKEKKITLVAVSHDLNLVGMFASEVALLENGKTYVFTKEEILNAEKIKRHFGVNSLAIRKNNDINITIVRENGFSA